MLCAFARGASDRSHRLRMHSCQDDFRMISSDGKHVCEQSHSEVLNKIHTVGWMSTAMDNCICSLTVEMARVSCCCAQRQSSRRQSGPLAACICNTGRLRIHLPTVPESEHRVSKPTVESVADLHACTIISMCPLAALNQV